MDTLSLLLYVRKSCPISWTYINILTYTKGQFSSTYCSMYTQHIQRLKGQGSWTYSSILIIYRGTRLLGNKVVHSPYTRGQDFLDLQSYTYHIRRDNTSWTYSSTLIVYKGTRLLGHTVVHSLFTKEQDLGLTVAYSTYTKGQIFFDIL